jgi:glutamine synthetase
MEIRIPGADLEPHYALAAIFKAGLRRIEKKLEVAVPPNSARTASDPPPTRLANNLKQAVDRFAAPTSIARELFSDEFVDFFAASRRHELSLWREAVTDW